MRAGFLARADRVLAEAAGAPGLGAAPLIAYTRAVIAQRSGDTAKAKAAFKAAEKSDATYCFPARAEDDAILRAAIAANPKDALAPYLLGNWLYDRRRHAEAIACFESAVKSNPKNAIAWRNLGIGYFNILKRPAKAKEAYEKAVAAKPGDARLFFERDQLWKRLGESPAKRIREFEKRRDLVSLRDDLTVESGALLNRLGRAKDAQSLVAALHKFQPWEGEGEGQALGLHTPHAPRARSRRPRRARQVQARVLEAFSTAALGLPARPRRRGPPPASPTPATSTT